MDHIRFLAFRTTPQRMKQKKHIGLLSRKYHPDANVGKTNQKELEEKFKEVQQAYSMIMDQLQGKTQTQQGFGGSGGYSTGGYGTRSAASEIFGASAAAAAVGDTVPTGPAAPGLGGNER